jgi:lactoylglutathione lyase
MIRSVLFYEKLGFKSVMNSQFEIAGEEGGLVAMMQSGEVIVELYQLPASHLNEIAARKNGHIDHIAFDVEDIDACYEELKQNGFTPLEEAPVFLAFWQKGCKYFIILGPDGERLEFNQVL